MEKKDYEALFLFSSQENVYNDSLSFVKELLTGAEAEIVSEEDMGIKRLAYEIKKRKDGHYYHFKLKMDGMKIKDICKELSLKEDVLRYIFIKIEKKYYPQKSMNRERRYQQQQQQSYDDRGGYQQYSNDNRGDRGYDNRGDRGYQQYSNDSRSDRGYQQQSSSDDKGQETDNN